MMRAQTSEGDVSIIDLIETMLVVGGYVTTGKTLVRICCSPIWLLHKRSKETGVVENLRFFRGTCQDNAPASYFGGWLRLRDEL
jgi:hypothetical protein